MTARHVLGILEDDEQRLWAAFDCAVALADAERARLTLAKTTDPGWMIRWCAPAALQSMCVSASELDLRVAASHALARAAEMVPACIPLTTVVLGRDTSGSILDLVRRRPCDAVVATDALLRRRRRLRRDLGHLGVCMILAARPSAAVDGTAPSAPDRSHTVVQT
jgi:nucleotide-binding universal stress UspA family protein